jgi:hypothetical protein
VSQDATGMDGAMKPAEARDLDVDTRVHVVCTCGKPNCVAPPPAGRDGTVYDIGHPPVHRIYVDLLDMHPHPNHHDDCSCVFLFKVGDVSLRD